MTALPAPRPHRTSRQLALLGLAVILWLLTQRVVQQDRGGSTPAAPELPAPARLPVTNVSLANLPLAFERNQGQTDPRVQYLVRSDGYTAFLHGAALTLALAGPAPEQPDSPPTSDPAAVRRAPLPRFGPAAALRLSFLGANEAVTPSAENPLPGVSHYLGSDDAPAVTDVPAFARVRYPNLYPGVDLLYYGRGRTLEYDLLLAPSASPDTLALSLDGADALQVDAGGSLLIHTAAGDLRMTRPVLYQTVNGVQRDVAGGYRLDPDGAVRFSVGAYDRSLPLVIDPGFVILWATYLSGPSGGGANALALDQAGNVYITGPAFANDFPVTPGAYSTTSSGFSRGYAAKISADGSQLIYATYLNGEASGQGIAVDAAGNAYVGGTVGQNFTTTPGAFDSVCLNKAFMMKLNPAGSAAVWATCFGSDGSTGAQTWVDGLTVDATGHVYATGYNGRSDFPVVNGIMEDCAGNGAWVAKFNTTGTGFDYATCIKPLADWFTSTYPRGIAIDASGAAYVVGEYAGPTDGTFWPPVPPQQTPLKPKCGDPTPGSSGTDSFILKLSPSGSNLLAATCFGGDKRSWAGAVVVDAASNVYVTGLAGDGNFPTTAGTLKSTCPNAQASGQNPDAYVVKFDAAISTRLLATCLGGAGTEDEGTAIRVDGAGTVIVAGRSRPIAAADFPLVNAPPVSDFPCCVFLAQLTPALSALLYATPLNRFGSQFGEAQPRLAVDPDGSLVVAGTTVFTDFPTTPGAIQPTAQANQFSNKPLVAKFTTPTPTPTPVPPTPTPKPPTPTPIPTIPPPGSQSLALGNVRFYADSVTPLSGTQPSFTASRRVAGPSATVAVERYKLDGNVSVSRFLRMEGAEILLEVDRQNATAAISINQGELFLDGLPFIGRKTLWAGDHFEYSLDANAQLTNLLQNGAVAASLRAAGLDVQIDSARMILDGLSDPTKPLGLRINGQLRFPAITGITGLQGNFTNMEITDKFGLRFTGEIVVPNVQVGGFGIKDVRLTWVSAPNPKDDVFTGVGTLITPAFQVGGSVRLVGGALDAVSAHVSGFGLPLLPPPPGVLILTSAEMEMTGLRKGPFTLRIEGDITVGNEWLSNLVKLSRAGIIYTAPAAIKATTDLEILKQNVAAATLGINIPKEFTIGAQVTLVENFPVLIISGKLSAGLTEAGPYFEGAAKGTVQIPNGEGVVYNAIRTLCFCSLPRTIAMATITVSNGGFSSTVSVPIVGDVTTAVRYINNTVKATVGTNLGQLGVNLPNVSAGSALAAGAAIPADRQRVTTPRLTTTDPVSVGSVSVPAGTPQIMVRVIGTATAPRFHLLPPGGGPALTPDNAAMNDAVFATNPDAALKESWFLVRNPAAGAWTVEAEDGTQGPFTMDALGANSAPSLSNVTAAQAGATVTIGYNAADPDDAATVSLYYDDGDDFTGELIATGLAENATGSHAWNTAGIPSGVYRVYAVIDDDKNTPVRAYAPGTLTVIDPLAPATPQGVSVSGGPENSILVQWTANSEPDLAGYQVQFGIDQGAATEFTGLADAGNVTSFRIPGLQNSTAYRVRVVAYDRTTTTDPGYPGGVRPESRGSLPSVAQTATTGVAVAPAPNFTAPSTGGTVQNNRLVNVTWGVNNGADLTGQHLELSTDNGNTWTPIKLWLPGDARSYAWEPALATTGSGVRLRLTAVDAAGNEGVATIGPFTLAVAPPEITAVGPIPLKQAQPQTVTIGGKDFQPGAAVKLGSTTLTTRVLAGNLLSVDIPAAAVPTTGSRMLTVTNPDNQSDTFSVETVFFPPSGHVRLQGRTDTSPGGSGFGAGHSLARITVKNGSGATVADVGVSADGSYALPALDDGTYTVTACAGGYLCASRPATVSSGLIDGGLPDITLPAGLVTADTAVNITDITTLIAAFGSRTATRKDANNNWVDLNGDGVVNILDITLTLGSFGRTSPISWP